MSLRVLLYAPNYIPATRYGGPIASSHGLAKALVRLGHDVHVFTTNVDGPGVLDVPLDKPVTIDGVQVRYFPVSAPKRFYHSPAMARAIDSEVASFDVAHVNGVFLWPGPRLASAAEHHEVPVIISPRGMLVPELIAGKSAVAKRLWIALKERPRLTKAAAIHVTSNEERDGVCRLSLDLAPITVLGNGVDPPTEPPPYAVSDDTWNGIPVGRRVVFLGRLDWTKGVDLAIDAVRALPDAFLLIAGPDQIGLRTALEPRLVRPDGSAAGRFIGPVEGPRKWALLAGADVLVAPSIKESFGMSVAEALAVGTAVVCTPGVGAAAIVARTDPAAVTERSSDAISRAISGLLDADERRRWAGAEGRRIIRSEFTWDAIARGMTEVYERARRATPRVGRLNLWL